MPDVRRQIGPALQDVCRSAAAGRADRRHRVRLLNAQSHAVTTTRLTTVAAGEIHIASSVWRSNTPGCSIAHTAPGQRDMATCLRTERGLVRVSSLDAGRFGLNGFPLQPLQLAFWSLGHVEALGFTHRALRLSGKSLRDEYQLET